MNSNPSFRDVEKLSAYLDGQLKPSEKAHLEARLRTEPELASVLQDLRQARGILRQLPKRRAPRNFTLTPKMVGLKPPMPRAYPVFRLATALATLLLFFTFATNFMAPLMTRTAAPVPYGVGGGYGGGGGGGGADTEMENQLLATAQAESAAPAAEAPMTEEPAAPSMIAPPQPTLGADTANDNSRAEPTPTPVEGEAIQEAPAEGPFVQKSAPSETLSQKSPAPTRPFGSTLQVVLAGIAILSALIAFLLRYIAIRKWRAKAK